MKKRSLEEYKKSFRNINRSTTEAIGGRRIIARNIHGGCTGGYGGDAMLYLQEQGLENHKIESLQMLREAYIEEGFSPVDLSKAEIEVKKKGW